MSRVHPDVALVRRAVRRWTVAAEVNDTVVVALSGGADSLALLAAAAHVVPTVRAVVVDHGVQEGSAGVAAVAAGQARAMGVVAQVVPVRVGAAGGPEAAARTARYAALRSGADGHPVLLGHTLDDQAETVLLGLGRGSGPRSIAGMRAWDPPWGRPLLDVRRDTTRSACLALGLRPWDDPHNDDARYTRVRLRHEVLPLLEQVLAGGVAPALARTATQLREDCAALDELAGATFAAARRGAELDAGVLGGQPGAIRRRVLRTWLSAHGATALTDKQLRWCDALIGPSHGQGGVRLGGRLVVSRRHGRLCATVDRAAL